MYVKADLLSAYIGGRRSLGASTNSQSGFDNWFEGRHPTEEQELSNYSHNERSIIKWLMNEYDIYDAMRQVMEGEIIHKGGDVYDIKYNNGMIDEVKIDDTGVYYPIID